MNQKGLSNTGYSVIIISIVLVAMMLTGCATRGWGLRNMTAISRYFDRDVNAVWAGVIQALEGTPVEVKDREKGIIRTQWVKGWSTEKSMGLLLEGHWQERYRLLIKVHGEQEKTYVSIKAQIEEKAPGGSRAYRWERIPSDGAIEQEYLGKLENILGEKLR